MPTNYHGNPNGNSTTAGWIRTGAGSTQATSEGLRWKSTAVDGSIKYSSEDVAPSGSRYQLGQVAIRRNTSVSDTPNYLRFAIYTASGWETIDLNLQNASFPVGQFVVIPFLKTVNTMNADRLFTVSLYGGGALDITVKNFYVYRQTDAPAEGVDLDSNDADFTASVPNNTLTATFTHGNNNELVNDLSWNYGDGDPAESGTALSKHQVTHTYDTAGTYNVSLTATNNFADTYTVTKAIQVPSGTYQAAFSSSTSYLTLNTDASASVGAIINTYAWDWGDGNNSTGQYGTHVYATGGAYNVTLTITNTLGQTSSVIKTITVVDLPSVTLSFSTTKTLLEVQFVPSKQDGVSYAWDFGDTNTSAIANPTHTYDDPGSYEVSLTVNGSLNVTQTVEVSGAYEDIASLGEALRLEVEERRNEIDPWNRIPNPSGEKGSFGWITAVGAIDSNNVPDAGFTGWKMFFTSSGSGAQTFYSVPVEAQPGRYVSFTWTALLTEGYYRLTVDAIGSDGSTVLGSSSTTGYYQADGTAKRTAVYKTPASTSFVRVKVQFTSDTGTGIPLINKRLMWTRAMLATSIHESSVTGLNFTDGSAWTDVLGPTNSISVKREALDVSTLQATILERDLDPALSDVLRPGSPVRLRVNTEDENGNSVWNSLYEGEITTADVDYERSGAKYVPAWTETVVPFIPAYDEEVTEGRYLTNVFSNPSFEEGTRLWPSSDAPTAMTVARSTAWAAEGTYSLKFTSSGSVATRTYYTLGPTGLTSNYDCNAGDYLSVRVRVKAIANCRVEITSVVPKASGSNIVLTAYVDVLAGAEATLQILDSLLPSNTAVDADQYWYIRFYNYGTTSAFSSLSTDIAYLDQMCTFNSGPDPVGGSNVPYFDGDSADSEWNGTADASTSTSNVGEWTHTVHHPDTPAVTVEHPATGDVYDPVITDLVLNPTMVSNMDTWGNNDPTKVTMAASVDGGVITAAGYATGATTYYAGFTRVPAVQGRTYTGVIRARHVSGQNRLYLRVNALDSNDVDLGAVNIDADGLGAAAAVLFTTSGVGVWDDRTFTLGTLPANTAYLTIWMAPTGIVGTAPNGVHTIANLQLTETYTPAGLKGARKATRIDLRAADAYTSLSQIKEPRGVAAIADLPELLEGTVVPYLVNGSGAQVSGVDIVSYNESASLIDQIVLARDTDSGYVHIDRNNVVVANDPVYIGTVTSGVLDENAYSGIDATFSFDECINSVYIVWLRYDSVANEVTEIKYGPYQDLGSISEWGLHEETFKFQGLVENPTAIEARAEDILATNSQPGRRVNSVTLPIRYTSDLTTGKAMLDLYDLVNVKYAETGTDEDVRITTIEHVITPTTWRMRVGFNADGTVSRPLATPSPSALNDENPMLYGLTVRNSLTGGGGLTADAGGGVAWSDRFITMGGSNNTLAPTGYFNITMPANATVIPVHGTTAVSTRTVASGLVPLGSWESLYYELPLRESGTTVNDDNFHIVGYTDTAANFEVPAHWVWVVGRNGDANTPYTHAWGDGRKSPERYSAQAVCSTLLTVSATVSDVIGATLSVPVRSTQDVYLVTGVFDVQTIVATAPGTFLGRLTVNAVVQSQQVVWVPVSLVNGVRLMMCGTWRVTGLAAGTRIFKLQASNSTASAMRVNTTHTTITVTQIA